MKSEQATPRQPETVTLKVEDCYKPGVSRFYQRIQVCRLCEREKGDCVKACPLRAALASPQAKNLAEVDGHCECPYCPGGLHPINAVPENSSTVFTKTTTGIIGWKDNRPVYENKREAPAVPPQAQPPGLSQEQVKFIQYAQEICRAPYLENPIMNISQLRKLGRIAWPKGAPELAEAVEKPAPQPDYLDMPSKLSEMPVDEAIKVLEQQRTNIDRALTRLAGRSEVSPLPRIKTATEMAEHLQGVTKSEVRWDASEGEAVPENGGDVFKETPSPYRTLDEAKQASMKLNSDIAAGLYTSPSISVPTRSAHYSDDCIGKGCPEGCGETPSQIKADLTQEQLSKAKADSVEPTRSAVPPWIWPTEDEDEFLCRKCGIRHEKCCENACDCAQAEPEASNCVNVCKFHGSDNQKELCTICFFEGKLAAPTTELRAHLEKPHMEVELLGAKVLVNKEWLDDLKRLITGK